MIALHGVKDPITGGNYPIDTLHIEVNESRNVMRLDNVPVSNVVQVVLIHRVVGMQARDLQFARYELPHHPQSKLSLVMDNV